MPTFQYEALTLRDRKRLNGVISASDERQARERLRDQDLMVTKIQAVNSKAAQAKAGRRPMQFLDKITSKFQNVSTKEKIAFTRNLSMMVKAGIPLTEALLYYENYTKTLKMKVVINTLRRDILAGRSLSQAMVRFPEAFDEVYINVVRTGESSGELDNTLTKLTERMEKAKKRQAKVTSALMYPAIVMVIVVLVLMVMFLLVLPTFEDVYEKLRVELPWITQVMLGISWALRNYWFVVLPLLGALGFGAYRFWQTPVGRAWVDKYILMVPQLGLVINLLNNASFLSTLLISFGSGLPIVEALVLSASTVNHVHMRAAFEKVSIKIQAGQSLSTSLAQTGYLPDLVMLMVSTGEESGELDKMLHSSMDYLEEETNYRIEGLIQLIEPTMLVVLGVIVGALALAIYLPLFSIYENLG
jgi:type II secretory pathway component PulF